MAYVRKRRGKRKGSRTPLKIATRDSSKADTLKAAAVSYFLKGGYSCFLELSVNSWGALRPDMIGVNLRQRIVLIETKSSVRDYTTDTKWRDYLPFSHKMYFVMCPKTYDKLKVRLLKDLKGTGVGVMTLNPESGFLDVEIACKNREIDDEIVTSIITRMAWRGGISKRTNRRTRHYLQEQDSEDEAQVSAKESRVRARSGSKRRSS